MSSELNLINKIDIDLIERFNLEYFLIQIKDKLKYIVLSKELMNAINDLGYRFYPVLFLSKEGLYKNANPKKARSLFDLRFRNYYSFCFLDYGLDFYEYYK